MSVITWLILIVVGFFIIKAASGIWYVSQATTNPHYWRLSMLNDIRRRVNILKQRGWSSEEAFTMAVEEKATIIDGFSDGHPVKGLFLDMIYREFMEELTKIKNEEQESRQAIT